MNTFRGVISVRAARRTRLGRDPFALRSLHPRTSRNGMPAARSEPLPFD